MVLEFVAGQRLLSGRYWWDGTGVQDWEVLEFRKGRYWSSGRGGTGRQSRGLGGGGRYRRGVHEARGVYILQASVSHQGEPPPGRDNLAPVTTRTDFTAAFIIYG